MSSGWQSSLPTAPSPLVHLSAIVNDPTAEGALGDYGALVDSIYGLYSSLVDPATPDAPPPLPPGVLADVTPADFERYLRRLAATWPAFVAARELCAVAGRPQVEQQEAESQGAWGKRHGMA